MLKLLKKMSARERLLMLVCCIFVVGQVYMDLKVPDYMSTITKLVKTADSAMNDIYAAGIKMILFSFGAMFFTIAARYTGAKLAATVSKNLRTRIFNAVQDFSPAEIDKYSTASLITRSTNDVTQVQRLLHSGLTMIIRMPIIVVLGIIKIVGKEWTWTGIVAGSVLVIVITIFSVMSYAKPRFMRTQALTDDLNRAARENMTGIRVVRAYNAEKYQEDKFSSSNDRLTNNSLEASSATIIMRTVMRFLNNSMTVFIYLSGAYIIASRLGSGDVLSTFSDMVVFSNYAGKILFSFMSLNMILMHWPRASVSANRINEVLDTELSLKNGSEKTGVEGQDGTIEFRNVSFTYPGAEAPVLHNISFTAKKGETVAFIGATGSGKTTLINLVPRFYDAGEGEVLVNGRNVKEYEQHALRDIIGYAPQRAVLFTGTVESNVSYGTFDGEKQGEKALEEVKKAVEIAQAKDFVEKMEATYEAPINRGGTNVSGGQKQRLSIARAVYKRPQIYIFDDTFSALDYKTDKTLRAALKQETAGVTTLIVAQRIGTIRDADCIIVLEDGRMVGKGTHSQLMQSCEVYKEIAYTQLSKEDLA